MLARQVQLGAAKGRMDRLQGWVDLDPQTT
jgi:hypothetical protein